MAELRPYGAAATIRIPMVKAGSRDLATGSDWTPAAGDVKVSKDGGAQANIGTLPSYSNGQWVFTLTGAEMSAKEVLIVVVDSATKAVDDQVIRLETYGNASAMHPFDLGQTTSLSDVQDNLEAYIDNNAASISVEGGTAQDGTATTITLAATAEASIDDYYVNSVLYIVGGTGARQRASIITGYDASTRVATVHQAFAVTPDATSIYRILPDVLYTVPQIQAGLATAAALATVAGNVSSILADTGTDGVKISAASLAEFWQQAFDEPTAMFTWASATPQAILSLLAALARNRVTQDGATTTLYADDGTTVIAQWATSDNGTTFTSAEAA